MMTYGLNFVINILLLSHSNPPVYFSSFPSSLISFSRSITKKIKDFAVQKRVKEADRGERTTMKDLS